MCNNSACWLPLVDLLLYQSSLQGKKNNRNCPEAISGRVKHPRLSTRHTPVLEHLAKVLQQTDCIGILSGSHQYLVALGEYKNRCVALRAWVCARVCVLAHAIGKIGFQRQNFPPFLCTSDWATYTERLLTAGAVAAFPVRHGHGIFNIRSQWYWVIYTSH